MRGEGMPPAQRPSYSYLAVRPRCLRPAGGPNHLYGLPTNRQSGLLPDRRRSGLWADRRAFPRDLLLIRLFQQAPRCRVGPRPPFPKSLRQFQVEFATEEACQKYLAACRWPDGFLCLSVGIQAYILEQKLRWQCAACRHQVSLTSGTVLHNTKTPLTVWFWAAYLMTTDKRGVSALLLQRQLGLSRYETAWMMLHKLRRAMVNAAREPLKRPTNRQSGLLPDRRRSGLWADRRAFLGIYASGSTRARGRPDQSSDTMAPLARSL